MEHIYKYAILTAIPNSRRGERVNVGVVVFLHDRVDVRFPGIGKIKALSHGAWEEYAQNVQRRLIEAYEGLDGLELFFDQFSISEPIVHLSEVSWFSTNSVSEYDDRINEILTALVMRPSAKKRSVAKRINTEISAIMRGHKILADDQAGIDQHKVVRDFYISKEEELKADFALRNGVIHVTATLDLRKSDSIRAKGDAAIKALVLDQVEKKYGTDAQRIGVYAVSEKDAFFKPHIEILKEYSNVTFNWSDEDDRKKYMRKVMDALQGPSNYQLTPTLM